jgi:F0F1-type ATP synthase membrane subunit b/b'
MNSTILAWTMIGIGVVIAIGVGWYLFSKQRAKSGSELHASTIDSVTGEAEKVFTEDFREELRNRGRLHFEKIINENAMFMQQDLHLTASQLNDYMRDSLKKALNKEFKQYTKSIEGAREAALESIDKTQAAMKEQRGILREELQAQLEEEKQIRLKKLDEHMSSVVNHYLLEALSEEVDMASQSDFIFQHLEDQKAAILEDIKSGW